MDQSYGTPDYGTPIPPYEEEQPKKSNTQMILIIVVLLVLVCCCCLVSSLGFLWYFGDQLIEQLSTIIGYFPL